MADVLRVLLLEDQPTDAELTLSTLRQAGFEPDWRRVETETDYLAALSADLDVILADYSLPQFDAPQALARLQERGLDIPFIVLTGTVTEDAVVACMRQGASDYLLKDRMARLGQAVARAIDEKRLQAAKRRAETALRENEARIQRLTESAQDVIYRYRLVPTAGLEYINPAITTIAGYTPAECYAKPGLLFSLIYEEDKPLLQHLVDAGSDLARSVTLRWVHKDGTILWTEQRNVLLRDEAGHVTAIEGIVRDITERKRSEEALRQSEANFRHLFANSPLPAWVYDLETLRYLDVNEAAVAHYGYSHEEFLALRITDIRPAEEVPRLRAYQAEPHGELRNAGEWRHLTKEGRVIDVEIAAHELAFAGRPAVLVVAQDITARKQAERALKDSEQRFRAVFEQSPLGISITRDGIRLFANQALARLFGYADPADLVGVSVLVQAAPQSRSELGPWLSKDPAQPLPSGEESFGLRKDGSVFPRALTIGSIDLPDGPAVVAFTSDLTEQNRLEVEARNAERLRIELEKEKELNQLKERFTSMVSHEFRTPLAVILSSADLVDRYGERLTPEKRLRHLREIQKQVQTMIALLDDVLDFSKAQAGKMEFDPQPLDIEALCKEIMEPMQVADAGAHRFSFVNRRQPGQAVLDTRLVRHILVNLLSNAIKYSPQGGEIRVELASEADQLVFSISDQGIGIPPADLPRLFEPFHRATNAAKIRGTGLGMAIVKSNVEAHGGTIAVQSQEGAGTTFRVRLPVSAPSQRD